MDMQYCHSNEWECMRNQWRCVLVHTVCKGVLGIQAAFSKNEYFCWLTVNIGTTSVQILVFYTGEERLRSNWKRVVQMLALAPMLVTLMWCSSFHLAVLMPTFLVQRFSLLPRYVAKDRCFSR